MHAGISFRYRIAAAIALSVIVVTASAARAQITLSGTKTKKKVVATDRVVTFETADGVTIEADWYPAKVEDDDKSPVAILIHMYPATRSSWKPMVPLLRDELGISVLAYDIRGTGGSTKPESLELKKKYEGPDPEHFAAATRDTTAAREWLAAQPDVDVNRMILIGASVGCSISLQYASGRSDVMGVACLSPGTNYMGIDSASHMKILKDTTAKVLLIAPKGEYGAVESLIEAAEKSDNVKGRKYPGGRENHGTRMFDAKYGGEVKERLQKFARGVLGIKKDAGKKSKGEKKRPKSG